jgi:signal transduction histidine kinase
VGSSLGAIKFSLESTLCDPALSNDVRQGIDATVQMVMHTIDEVRRIINNLRPPLLERVGLIASLQGLERQHASVYESTTIHLRFDIGEENIPERLKIVIFRVVQEAFHNMAKYSQATEAEVELILNEGRIVLSIEDNGVGFDPFSFSGENASQGLGLSTMRERVVLAGGKFSIDSAVGAGTRIEAVWPAAP